MSVATKNPFALLDAEDTSRSATPAPATEAAQPSTTAATRGNQRGRGGPASRGGKYYQRGGGAKSAPPRENEAEEPAPGGEKPKRPFDGEGRGEGRGRGRGRGRGDHRGDRQGGGDRPPREGGRGGPRNRETREPRPDRHSATGKTDSDKKVHQSWGGDDGPTELKVEEAATGDAAAEGGNDWGNDAAAAADDPWKLPATSGDEPPMPPSATAEGGDKAEGRRGRDREPEEEDNTLTLEQYLAQKAEKEASLLPKLEARKANEGADDSLWKDAIKMMKGEEEESYFAGKTKSAPKTRSEKKEKIYIEIDGRFERSDRGRGGPRGGGGGRGDRGNDRGLRTPRSGGGRFGGRSNGYSSSPAIVNVDDESAFPSLS